MTDSRKQANETDLSAILADPSLAYDKPMDVVGDPRLDTAQKRRVLEEWKLDAQKLQVAAAEGMDGGEPNMMQRVAYAMAALDETKA